MLTLERHTAEAIKIEAMDVIPALHRCGISRVLVEAAMRHAIAKGVRTMMVKTLAPSHPGPNYTAARHF